MKRILVFVALASSLGANAEGIDSYDGAWVAEWQTPGGRPASATLDLRDGAGLWKLRVLARTLDPCVKVAAPAKVELIGEQPVLNIEPAAVIAGCSGSRMKLTKTADGAIKGTWRDGREVVITRR